MPEGMNITQQNDLFRTDPYVAADQGIRGRIVITSGVQAFDDSERIAILRRVIRFNHFTEDNDPYGEHDFGSFEYKGRRFFWKIDYYDTDYKFGSPDQSDRTVTARALTVMLASEY